jgi:unsaturated chondroitin disaccharide hydrolase
MAVLSFFATLLLISYGATAFDLMRYASDQYTILYREFVNSSGTFYPAYGHPLEAYWASTTATTGWTSGFFPGVLWNLYAYNNSPEELKRALDVTTPTAPFANRTDTHDIGFIIMSGYGNAYRLLRREEYLNIMVTAARSLITRYSSTVRCIRSWNSAEGFLVIIDNMMNLELLFEVSNLTKDQTFYDIAWQHANRTMYEHIRDNNSSYHVVEYNETDGSVIRKYTAQGERNSYFKAFSSAVFM